MNFCYYISTFMEKLKKRDQIKVSMGTILEYAWLVLKNHRYLLALVTLSLFVIFTLSEYKTAFVYSSSVNLLLDLVVLLFVFYILLIVFYVLAQPSIVSPKDTFIWFIKNIGWYTWTSVFFFASLFFGYILFIVPGIVLSVYLLFVPIVFFNKKVSGLATLEYSLALVYGHWWRVLYRLLVLSFLTVLLTLTVFVMLVVFVDILPVFREVQNLLVVLSVALSSAAGIIFWSAGILRIYNSLISLSATELVISKKVRLVLQVFSIFGVLTLLGLFLVAWF